MMAFYRIPALFLTGLCHIVIVCHMLKLKYAAKRLLLYSGICLFGFVGIGVYGYAAGGIRGFAAYLVVSACVLLYSCMISSDYFAKKCFLFITYFCLFTVLDNMLKLMVGMLFPQISELAGFYLAIVPRSALLLLILAWYRKYAMEVFSSLTDGSRRWWNLALIALLFFVLQDAVALLNLRNVLPKGYLFLMFVAVSFVMGIVYSVVFSNISYMKKDAEAANRRMRHDMRHHMDAIAEYAKAGEDSAILAYIREYSAGISETAVKRYSENRTVNSILSSYAGKAGRTALTSK